LLLEEAGKTVVLVGLPLPCYYWTHDILLTGWRERLFLFCCYFLLGLLGIVSFYVIIGYFVCIKYLK
jgi:hypothetical protein